MKLLSWNVQSLRDLENENGKYRGPFPELTFKSRWPDLKKSFDLALKEHGTEIFVLQEIGTEGESLLQDYFNSIHYSCVITPYCLDKAAFRFAFAFNPNMYELIGHQQLPYTQTGLFLTDEQRQSMSMDEKMKHNLGVEFEKSAQVMILKNLETGLLVKIYNTHPGLTNEHRLACMDVLARAIDEDKKAGLSVVVAGDMNQFDAKSPIPKVLLEQPEKLERVGLTWLDKKVLLECGAQSTFRGYAFDILRFLTKSEKDSLFAMIDAAGSLKKLLQDPTTNPQAKLSDLEALYKQIRVFFQTKQNELINADANCGAGLSTDLDFIGVTGPLFGNNPQDTHCVGSYTLHRGAFFNTSTIARDEFEKQLQEDSEKNPLPSDHFALILEPRLMA